MVSPGGHYCAARRKRAFLTNGWSFLHAFLSWASLLRAIPDIFKVLQKTAELRSAGNAGCFAPSLAHLPSEQTCSPESGKRRLSSTPETTLSKSLDGRQTPTGDPSLLPSAGHQGRVRGLKHPLPSPRAPHPSVSISEVQRGKAPGLGHRDTVPPSRHLAPVPTLVTCSSSKLE